MWHMSAEVLAFPVDSEVMTDTRDGDRAMRATWHFADGVFVLSLWRGGVCAGSAHLSPDEAARLCGQISRGLGRLATPRI